MLYPSTLEARFLDRPNRFIAHVDIAGNVETVHIKNTGRCKELLLPGVSVMLAKTDNPNRKTKYDLIAVEKKVLGWVNIDSQAPNVGVREWLKQQDFDHVQPEYVMGIRASTSTWKKERGNICWRSRAAHWRLTALAISLMRPRNAESNISENLSRHGGRGTGAASHLQFK